VRLPAFRCWGLVLFWLAWPAHAAVDTCRDHGSLHYDVTLDGEAIGSHRIQFQRNGAALVMDATSDIRVERLLFTVYRRDYRSREVWHGDALQSVDTTLVENGRRKERQVARIGGGLHGLVGDSDAFPASYWSLATVRQSRLFDTADGRVLAINVRDLGTESVRTVAGAVPAQRYAVNGELTLELWYDAAGCWLKMRYDEDGYRVEFTRR
jgi:hypothetical protein